MNDVLNALVLALQNDLLITLSVGIGCLIAALCLEKRSHMKLRVALSFAAAFSWMVFMRFMGIRRQESPELWGIICYSVLFFFFGVSVSFWSRASFLQSLYAITVSYSLQNMCERLIEIPRISLTNFPLLLDRLCLAGLMSLSLAIYYQFLIGRARQRSMFDFTKKNSRLMLLTGVGVVVVTLWLDIRLRGYAEQGNIGLANCHNLMSALYSFLIILVCMSQVRQTDSERRAEMSDYLLHSERERYEQDKRVHDALNIKCHDIRHQIAALGEEGYRSELKKIGRLVDVYDAAPRTQNVALDVILAGKMLACTNQGITLTCLADGRRMGFMEDCDIYALFGNILDNAMEAAESLTDPEKRMISLTVNTSGDFLHITCENFYAREVTFREGLPETSKADRDYHGFGTRSIRFLTEKYGGDLKIAAEDGVFRLSIMLPIPA